MTEPQQVASHLLKVPAHGSGHLDLSLQQLVLDLAALGEGFRCPSGNAPYTPG
ncbi:hypothetical protein SLAV_06520 [Streptomyces lavendulae subsp. lavendulae]|uniref:Uncharacterized protein n=1 Tax=Streptomyces lavendulae subsp. lavendulae TaxID=58340 RepID=A0A2K8P8Y6_STRLA|nr:hypothetical protein SLAV_06520 [Streptomyces lavendulae subsp. lavendulae]QUQ53042.1 hypothetical protein SLLC_04535 [Streptomyces lavendulae subsp. lavendulae]